MPSIKRIWRAGLIAGAVVISTIQPALAQNNIPNYDGVETFDLAQLQSELKDVQSLMVLQKTKHIIDENKTCKNYTIIAKQSRKSLLNLNASYQNRQPDAYYARKEKEHRYTFKEALQTYEKCFDEHIGAFPHLNTVAGIYNLNTYNAALKPLTQRLSQRGDLNTYTTMLNELIAFETSEANVNTHRDLGLYGTQLDTSVALATPLGTHTLAEIPAITLAQATLVLTRFINAYHYEDIEGTSENLSPSLQGMMLRNVEKKGISAGLLQTAGIRQEAHHWWVKCGKCWDDTEHGHMCKFRVHTYFNAPHYNKVNIRMFRLQNIATDSNYATKITSVYSGSRKELKELKKRDGKTCKGFETHLIEK